LKQLESNAFGIKALEMIVSAPERYQLHGRIRSWGPPVGNMPGVGI